MFLLFDWWVSQYKMEGANAANEDRTLTLSLQRAIRKVGQRKSA
jgi:hypothetical protein